MEKISAYQKELIGFEAKEELVNITSNNQFVISYDVNKNLCIYDINSQKQQKITANLPNSNLIDIKMQFCGSLFIISFENSSIILLDANNPEKIINVYNYLNSIDEKEHDKLKKSKQTCYFRNLTFVDNMTFIAVLQKGSKDKYNEQLFKFSITESGNSSFMIKNYCEVIQYNTSKENGLIGNPLKIFDDSFHITRISSILTFSENDEKSDILPQMIGISLKKKNKFLIATVNNFRFEIIQSFTADNSISTFSHQQGSDRINLAFLSYSYHMIFVKTLKIPNESNQKIQISDVCIIKLPVIICSNLRFLSFISPDLISIVFSSPGSLNISIYSIQKGKIVGVLPPVTNTNLFLNSNFSVASSVTSDAVFLISKGSALSFSNKIVSKMVDEGKFVTSGVDDFFKSSTARSESLLDLYRSLSNQQNNQNFFSSVTVQSNSKKSSNLISFWNSLSSEEKLSEKRKSPKLIKTGSRHSIKIEPKSEKDDFVVSNREDFDKFKESNQIKEGIEYCIDMYNRQLSNENDTNEIKEIKLHAVDFLKRYVKDELNKPDLDTQKLMDEIVNYSKKLSIVKEWLLTKSVLSSFPPSFAGDVYEDFLNDHSNALNCYEIDKRADKIMKIIVNHSASPAVLNWLFSCVNQSNEISFPRLSNYLVKNDETQSIQILKRIFETARFYSNLNMAINALLITFSNEKIGSENELYKFVESFIIENNSSLNSFSKKSLDFLLNKIFTNEQSNPDNRENLLIALLKSKENVFPNSSTFSFKLYQKCRSIGFKKAEEIIKEINLEKPDFNILIFIDYTLTFIRNKPIESDEFETGLNEKRKIIFDYISSEYQETANENVRKSIENIVSKNITNLVCIFSLTSPKTTIKAKQEKLNQNYLEKLFSDIFPEEFVRKVVNECINNDEILLTVIHALINDGINKSFELLEIVSSQIIQLIPFIITNQSFKDDIKKFIIVGSHHFHDNKNIHDCLSSAKLLTVCESHSLYDCCCLICIINDLNEKAVFYLQQLILSLKSKDFTIHSEIHQQICSAFYFEDNLSDNDEEFDNEFINDEVESEESFDFVSSEFFKLIPKVKSNIDIVKLTSLKLFNDDLKNAWKSFMLLVDSFVNAVKIQADSIGTYFLDEIITLYHDVCFIMSSNEKNNIDFCEIIRVSRQSFACLCESLQNNVLSRLIADQIYSPHTMKTIEKIILEKPLMQKSIIKQAYCARCGMPMFIDDVGIYTFNCGHAVHNLAFCKRNSKKCPICSEFH